mgnify:CR=1 FL=1
MRCPWCVTGQFCNLTGVIVSKRWPLHCVMIQSGKCTGTVLWSLSRLEAWSRRDLDALDDGDWSEMWTCRDLELSLVYPRGFGRIYWFTNKVNATFSGSMSPWFSKLFSIVENIAIWKAMPSTYQFRLIFSTMRLFGGRVGTINLRSVFGKVRVVWYLFIPISRRVGVRHAILCIVLNIRY